MTNIPGISHEYWKIGDIKMHVATSGEGEPVLLLHGFPELWYSWRKIIPMLSDKYRIIAPDLKGYGMSDIPNSGYDIETLSNDIACIIDKIGEKTTIVCHDWGGVIGWHTAMTYPDRVKALIPVAAPHVGRYFNVMLTNPFQFLKSQYTFFFQLPYLPEYLLSMNKGIVLTKLMKWSSVRSKAFSESELEFYRNAWENKSSMNAGLNYYRKLFRNLPKTVKYFNQNKVKCPVCVVWGDKDWFLSIALTEKLEKYCEYTPEVHILSDCGHWVSQEAPDELSGIIDSFIKNSK